MTRAIDPFEEYLRKKKVEMLETKYRGPRSRQSFVEDVDEDQGPVDADQEERLQEEVQDFFESGQSAAARLFDRVGDGLPEEQVDEIRDALEEVFVETEAEPQAEGDGTFVNFFREVQTSFDEEHAERERAAVEQEGGNEVVAPTGDSGEVVEPPPAPKSARSREMLPNGVEFVMGPKARPREETPIPFASEDLQEAETAELGSEGANAALAELFAAEQARQQEAEQASRAQVADDEENDDARTEAAEAIGALAGYREAGDAAGDETAEVRIDLAAILAELGDREEDLRTRVDLLGRLVARLVERSGMPQHELVEMLIRSGVEF